MNVSSIKPGSPTALKNIKVLERVANVCDSYLSTANNPALPELHKSVTDIKKLNEDSFQKIVSDVINDGNLNSKSSFNKQSAPKTTEEVFGNYSKALDNAVRNCNDFEKITNILSAFFYKFRGVYLYCDDFKDFIKNYKRLCRNTSELNTVYFSNGITASIDELYLLDQNITDCFVKKNKLTEFVVNKFQELEIPFITNSQLKEYKDKIQHQTE